MKLSYKLVIAGFFVTVIGSFIWSANHYYSKYQYEKKRADEAVRNAESATAITNNVLAFGGEVLQSKLLTVGIPPA